MGIGVTEGRSQTRVGNGLAMGDSGIRVIPLRGSGKATSMSVGAFPSEAPAAILRGVAHFLEILFEFIRHVDNESGCSCGEKTGLYSQKNQMNTAVNVSAEGVLTKVNVFGSSLCRDRTRRFHVAVYRRTWRGHC